MKTEECLQSQKPSADAMRLHPFYRGKIETTLKCTVHSFDDFAIWYTPEWPPCKAIQAILNLSTSIQTMEYRGRGQRWDACARLATLAKAACRSWRAKHLLYKYLAVWMASP